MLMGCLNMPAHHSIEALRTGGESVDTASWIVSTLLLSSQHTILTTVWKHTCSTHFTGRWEILV